jgi:type III restriction enzyme
MLMSVKVIKYRKRTVLNSPEFEALWQRICQKNTVSSGIWMKMTLIKSCTKSLSEMQPVAKSNGQFSAKATIKQKSI